MRASPLWTLQRLCFEPDVAADTSDRGENRDPGQANRKKGKWLLTREMQAVCDPAQYLALGRDLSLVQTNELSAKKPDKIHPASTG